MSRPVVPISVVDIGDAEVRRVEEVLRSGRLAQGPVVEELETEFARMHGVTHAIAVSNGTTALTAALQALGVKPGDEIITSPFTFVATLNAILEVGAVARFADVGPDYCISADSVAPLVGPRTIAIMPVHLYGLPADMGPIHQLAERHGLAIVEDAAQAHGAKVEGRSAGSWGIGCFSLYATKNVTSGEGGIVTTNDAGIADRIRLLRNQGMRARYQYEIPGHNYRLTDLQAAIALPQIARLGHINSRRNQNASYLDAGLSDLEHLRRPVTPEGREHVFHQYTVAVRSSSPLDRGTVVSELAKDGVTAGVYYPKLVHDYDCYRGIPQVRPDPTPTATEWSKSVLSLPVHQRLAVTDLDHVIESTRRLLG